MRGFFFRKGFLFPLKMVHMTNFKSLLLVPLQLCTLWYEHTANSKTFKIQTSKRKDITFICTANGGGWGFTELKLLWNIEEITEENTLHSLEAKISFWRGREKSQVKMHSHTDAIYDVNRKQGIKPQTAYFHSTFPQTHSPGVTLIFTWRIPQIKSQQLLILKFIQSLFWWSTVL